MFIIKKNTLKKYKNKFNKKSSNKVFKNITSKNKLKNIVLKSNYAQTKKTVFKKFIKEESSITDQKYSGRCWIFAFSNVMRLKMIKKYNLKNDFEFSQNYLSFYDKLEKCNFFINYIVKNINKNIDTLDTKKVDLKIIHILDNLINDGGQWNNFVNIVKKYGIIPKSCMNDLLHSKYSSELNNFLNNFLRKKFYEIHNNSNFLKNKQKNIDKIMYDCYKILVIFLGEPPKKIDWKYYKKKTKKAIFVNDITPIEFYKKYIPYNLDDKLCLINYPCKTTPFYNLYNTELAFNLPEKNSLQNNFINVPIDIMKEAVKKSIDDNEAVWCGLDIDKYISVKYGFLDKSAFNYDNLFGFNTDLNKCNSLTYRQSNPNHAIIIKGYNFENKQYNFMIENSWGSNDDDNFEGHFNMSNEWFNNYVYMVVVDKKFVSKKVKNVLNKKSIELPYWNPFGSLL
jgi:bleomycin hydrolase